MRLRLVLVLSACACAALGSDQPILGAIVSGGAVHKMNRTSLEAELALRETDHAPWESDDVLRLRLHEARARLLERRNAHVLHAERVLAELNEHSGATFLSDLPLDAILADDNAVFAAALGGRLLSQLNMQTAAGSLLGVVLCRFAPLGRLPSRARLLPLTSTVTVAAATATLLGLLQAATQGLRQLAGCPSDFGQKLAAVTCRDGVAVWVDAAASEAAEAVAGGGSASGDDPPRLSLWAALRRPATRGAILLPILQLAAGSSMGEEVLFRALLLHGLVSKARLPAPLAAALSSAVFGAMHIWNERSAVQRSIYAAWTFLGGLVFGAAYLGTGGGLALPVLLHFGNNFIVQLVCVRKVAQAALAQRNAFVEARDRVVAGRAAAGPARSRVVGSGGGVAPAKAPRRQAGGADPETVQVY